MGKLYQNRDWLYNQRTILKKFIPQIAKEQGVTEGTVGRWVKIFDIKGFSRGDARHFCSGNHVNLISKAIEFVEGELLGDGHLEARSKYSARYEHPSKHKEYLEWLSKQFDNFGIKQSGKINGGKFFNKKGKIYYRYSYNSLSYSELLPLWQKWYRISTPEDSKQWKRIYKFIKIVPRDIELTPLVCRQWYIGDGSLQHNNRSKNRKDSIALSTDGFSIVDVEFLVKKLNQIGFKCGRTKSNGIYIYTKSTPAFLKYIGDCPIDCYRYKWKLKK